MDLNKVEYKVMPEHRVVIATIRNITYDPEHIFNDKFMPHASSKMYMNLIYNQKFCMPDALKAVARCHPEDEFDAEKGKAIALNKLVEKYNESLDRHLYHIATSMRKCLDNMDTYLKKHKVI